MKQSTARYSIDAPYVIRGLLLGAVGTTVVYILSFYSPLAFKLLFTYNIFTLLFNMPPKVQYVLSMVAMIVPAVLMILSSLWGKQRQRDILLKQYPWKGDETVLDIGCGRGLLLIGAAKRLTTGKAYGIDIWSGKDLSSNSKAATQHNCELEGVADKVTLLDADARKMPFEDEKFDVIVSSMVVHNIDKAGRKKAIKEMIRVCKKGGVIFIQDFQCTDEYMQLLREAGLKEVAISGLYWNIFPPVKIVHAVK
jgi:ubiquinone/menaquinone biosynthesis C-methylase UbiE